MVNSYAIYGRRIIYKIDCIKEIFPFLCEFHRAIAFHILRCPWCQHVTSLYTSQRIRCFKTDIICARYCENTIPLCVFAINSARWPSFIQDKSIRSRRNPCLVGCIKIVSAFLRQFSSARIGDCAGIVIPPYAERCDSRSCIHRCRTNTFTVCNRTAGLNYSAPANRPSNKIQVRFGNIVENFAFR